MITAFVLTNAAKADLKEIGRYTQDNWGLAQRDRYLTMLDESFHKLSGNQLMGQDCSDIRPSYRKYHVGKHFVFYRQLASNQIEIVRILHERMDVEIRIAEL